MHPTLKLEIGEKLLQTIPDRTVVKRNYFASKVLISNPELESRLFRRL